MKGVGRAPRSANPFDWTTFLLGACLGLLFKGGRAGRTLLGMIAFGLWVAQAMVRAWWWGLDAGQRNLVILLALIFAGLWVAHLVQKRRPPAAGGVASTKVEREPIPQWLRLQIAERDGWMCGICGFKIGPDELHIDHIHPVHAGGTNDPENLQATHGPCNLRKGGQVGWQRPYFPERRTG